MLLALSLTGLVGTARAQTEGASTLVKTLADDALALPSRNVFVPFEELQQVPVQGTSAVLLPQADYDRLLRSARESATLSLPPGVAGLVSQAKYAASRDEHVLMVEATASLEQAHRDWQLWSIALPGVAIESATVDGQPAQIARPEDGSLQLFTFGAGTHTFHLKYSLPLATAGSDRLAVVPLLPSPIGEFEISAPAGQRVIAVETLSTRPAPIEQPASYRWPVGGKSELPLRWTTRADQRLGEAMHFATTGYGLRVTPGGITWAALTTLQVFGRPLDEVVGFVPDRLEIAEVTAPGLEAWSLDTVPDHPGQTRITLKFRQPVDGRRQLNFRGVMATGPNEPWSVPVLQLPGVESHVGQIVLQHAPVLRLRIEHAAGVRRALESSQAASDMPEISTGPAVTTERFDFWRPDFELQIVTEPKPAELSTAVAGVLSISASFIGLSATTTLNPRQAGLFEIDATIPRGWNVTSLTRDGQPVAWRLEGQGPETGAADTLSQRVHVVLEPPVPAGGTVVLTWELRHEPESWPPGATPVTQDFPPLHVLQSTLTERSLIVQADEDFNVTVASTEGVDSLPVDASVGRLRFESQEATSQIRLNVSMRPAQLSVQSALFARLDPTTTHVHQYAQIEIRGGSTNELFVDVPETLGTNLQFRLLDGPKIIEQTPQPPANGLRRWRLGLVSLARGTVAIATDVTLPRPDPAALVETPAWRIGSTVREQILYAVEASSEQRVGMTALAADGQPLTEVDTLELPLQPYAPRERIVGVFRSVTPGGTLTLRDERFDRGSLPTTVCQELTLESVWSGSQQWQHSATYRLRAAGTQALAITLPEGAELWSVMLGGQPVEIRRAGARLLVSLSTLDEAVEHTLKLVYRTQTEGDSLLKSSDQREPSLAAITGVGTEQAIPVVLRQWRVTYPRDNELVDLRGDFESTRELSRESWLSRLFSLRDISWGDLLFPLAVLGGVAVLVVLGVLVGRWLLALSRMPAWLAAVLVSVIGLSVIITALSMLTATSIAYLNRWYDDYDVRGGRPTSVRGIDGPARAPLGEAEAVFEGKVVDSLAAPAEKQAAPSQPQQMFDRAYDAPPPESPPMPSPDQPPSFDKPMADAVPQLAQAEADEKKFNEWDADGAVRAPAGQAPIGQPQVGQPQAGEPQAGLNGRATKSATSRFGLLSLTIGLPELDNSQTRVFQYRGSAPSDQEAPSLGLTFSDRRLTNLTRWFVVILVVTIGWWCRHLPKRQLVAASVVLIGLAIGLAPLSQGLTLLILDGFAAGGAILIAIWTVCAVQSLLALLLGRVLRSVTPRRATALLLLASAGLVSGLAARPAHAQAAPVPHDGGLTVTGAEPTTGRTVLVHPLDSAAERFDSERVLIPHDEFLRLYRLAHPELTPASEAPIRAGVVEALYRATLVPAAGAAESLLRLQARLVVTSGRDTPELVVLPLGDVAIEAASLDGQPAPIVPQGQDRAVVLRRRGTAVLDLTFAVAARLEGEGGSTLIPLRPVAAGRFHFTLPAPSLEVRVNGSSTAYRKISEGDQTAIEFGIDRSADLTLQWQPPLARNAQSAVTHVETTSLLELSDAGLRQTTNLAMRVRQGSLSEAVFSFPASLRLQSVGGPDVGGWELSPAPAVAAGEAVPPRTLRVSFRRTVSDQTLVSLVGYLPTLSGDGSQSLELPIPAPVDATTEVGAVGVIAAPQFNVKAGELTSAVQTELERFQWTGESTIAGASPQLAFRFSRRPVRISIVASRQQPRLTSAGEHGVWVTHRKQLQSSRFVLTLSGQPRSNLAIALPAGMLLLEVRSADLTDWYLSANSDQQQVTLEWATPRTGQIEVTLVGRTTLGEATGQLQIAVPSVIDAERSTHSLAVWLEDGQSVTIPGLNGWRSFDAGTADISNDLKQLRNGQPPQLAFSSNLVAPPPITLSAEQARTQYSGATLVMTTHADLSTDYTLGLQWEIAQAPVDALYFVTPAWLADRLEFRGEGIRQTSSQPVGNDQIRWTISLRAPVRGRYFATATSTFTPAVGQVTAPAVQLQMPQGGEMVAIAPQQNYSMLINLSESVLTAVDPGSADRVKPAELPMTLGPDLFAQATELARLQRWDAPRAWSIENLARTETAPASVNIADLMTVLAADGSYRGRAVYTIKNRRRQFLALTMPSQSAITSVFVAGQPQRVVTQQGSAEGYALIPLPKTTEADRSFVVELHYSGRLAGPLPSRRQLSAKELDIPGPNVVSLQNSADYGIPVARTRWSVYLPERLTANPLRTLARHNLSPAEDGSTESLYAQAALQEINELLVYCESIASKKSFSADKGQAALRYNVALDNLRQLEQSASVLAAQTNSSTLRGELLQVQERVNRSQALQQSANGGQRGVEVELKLGAVDDTLRQQVTANNDSFYNTNGISPAIINETAPASNDFRFKEQAAKSDATKDEPVLAKGLKSRDELRSQNSFQLDQLNRSAVESVKRRSGTQEQLSRRKSQTITIPAPSSATAPAGPGEPHLNAFGDGAAKQGGARQEGIQEYYSRALVNQEGGATSLDDNAHRVQNLARGGLSGGGGMGGMGGMSEEDAELAAEDLGLQYREQAAAPRNGPEYRNATPGDPLSQPPQGSVAAGGLGGGFALGMQLPNGDDANGVILFNDGVNAQGQQLFGRENGSATAERKVAGLSLPVELPTGTEPLVFIKTGGDARLALSIRPQASKKFSGELLWAVTWLLLAALVAGALLWPSSGRSFDRLANASDRSIGLGLASAVTLLGLAVTLMLSLSLGAIIFAVGFAWLCWVWTRPHTAAGKPV